MNFFAASTLDSPFGPRPWVSARPSRGIGSVFAGFLSTAAIALAFAFACAGCASSAPGTIGAAIGQQADHRLFVRSVPPGQGADRAGLVVDDEILLIDGKPVQTMSSEDVRRAVRGDVGSTLMLTIVRKNQQHEIKVVRTPLLAEREKKETSR